MNILLIYCAAAVAIAPALGANPPPAVISYAGTQGYSYNNRPIETQFSCEVDLKLWQATVSVVYSVDDLEVEDNFRTVIDSSANKEEMNVAGYYNDCSTPLQNTFHNLPAIVRVRAVCIPLFSGVGVGIAVALLLIKCAK